MQYVCVCDENGVFSGVFYFAFERYGAVVESKLLWSDLKLALVCGV